MTTATKKLRIKIETTHKECEHCEELARASIADHREWEKASASGYTGQTFDGVWHETLVRITEV